MVLDEIKGMRGMLYRKLKKEERRPGELPGAEDVEAERGRFKEIIGEKEKEMELPGFAVKKPKHIVEFPEMEDVTQLNVTYPLMEPFVYANIRWDKEKKELVYVVVEPQLTAEEKKLLKQISDAMIELIDVQLSAIKEQGKAIEYLEKQVVKIIKEFGVRLTRNQYIKLMYYIYRNFVGFNEINALLDDPNIEDISCDGVNTPLYIIHRKVGSIKTNIIFSNMEELREFVIKLAERCNRYVSYAEPILDGTLPDGSRVSATLAGDVATRGPTFTIRKFSERPISPIEQMDFHTVSAEMLAYYWFLIENGASMLIVGGVATGKTSFLNSLCMFIPPEAKIVSIEDTRELRIPNEHWVPSLARVGFGIPMPTGEKYGGVSLFDLLKESFRQNPDYVIVGETRGKEAYVMFQGMSSGHPSMSTFHAGSIDTVIKRLTTPPIELSPSLLESLNVISIMIHAREKGKSARRVREIVEIISVDPKTDEVCTNVVFKWDPVTDKFEKVNESVMVEKFIAAKGGTAEEAVVEIDRRRQVVEWMFEAGIKDFEEVTEIVNLYYKERKKIFEMMAKEGRELKAGAGLLAAARQYTPMRRPELKGNDRIKAKLMLNERHDLKPVALGEEAREEAEAAKAAEEEEMEEASMAKEREEAEREIATATRPIAQPRPTRRLVELRSMKDTSTMKKETGQMQGERPVSVLSLLGFKFIKEK